VKTLPQEKIGWVRVALLPFQAFDLLGWFAVALYSTLDTYGRRPASEFETEVVFGYIVCFVGLVIGGLAQRNHGDRTGSVISFSAAIVALLASWVMLPELARP
jgi:hypothetical protein